MLKSNILCIILMTSIASTGYAQSEPASSNPDCVGSNWTYQPCHYDADADNEDSGDSSAPGQEQPSSDEAVTTSADGNAEQDDDDDERAPQA